MMENVRTLASLRAYDRQPQARQAGFTLIEVMVVMVIMGILLGIGIPSFQTWRERTALRSASEALMAHLKQARHLSFTMNRNVVFTIQSATKPYSYTLDDGCGCTTEKTVQLDAYSDTLEFGSSTNVASLTFKGSSWMSGGTISVYSTRLGEEKTIIINGIGRSYWQ